MVYVFLISIGGLLLLVDLGRRRPEGIFLSKYIFYWLLLFMAVIGGLRYNVGADFSGYLRMYQSAPALFSGVIGHSQQAHGGLAFYFIAGVIKLVGGQAWLLFLTFTIASLSINSLVIRRYAKNFGIAFFLYLCFSFFGRDMGQIRQGLATAISFYSIYYIEKQNPLRFTLTLIIASLFHPVSVIFAPFYFFGRVAAKRYQYVLFLIAGLIIGRLGVLDSLIAYLPGDFIGIGYVGSIRYGASVSIFSASMIRRLLPAILVLLFYDKFFKTRDLPSIITSNMVIIGAFLSLIFIDVAIFIERLVVPYLVAEVIIFSNMLTIINNKYWKTLWVVFCLLYGAYFVYNLLNGRHGDFFPYNNVILESQFF